MADGINLVAPPPFVGAATISGLYIAGGAVSGSVAPTQNRLQYIPFVAARTFTVSAVILNCATAAAANVYRNGIYNDSGFGYPGTLLADWGTVDLATTGNKSITGLSTVVPGGRITWIAGALQAGTGAAVDLLTSRLFGFLFPYDDIWGNAPRGLFEDAVSGALPATAFAGSAPTASNLLGSNPAAQRLLVA